MDGATRRPMKDDLTMLPAAPTLGHRDRRFRGVFAGCLPITLLTIVVLIGVYLYLNQWVGGRVDACQNAILIYPGSTLISESEQETRPLGPVETRIELTTPDDAATVESWYTQTWGAIVRQQTLENDDNFFSPPRGWQIQARENGGSVIRIAVVCPG